MDRDAVEARGLEPVSEKDAREILIEIVRLGSYAKVSAIDPVTRIEVSIVGPANADEASLKAVVLRKLELALKKKSGGT